MEPSARRTRTGSSDGFASLYGSCERVVLRQNRPAVMIEESYVSIFVELLAREGSGSED